MSDLVLGRMEHARPSRAERAHRFVYPWFGIVARYPIRGLGRWFTHNRWGFLRFDDRDHGLRDGSDPLIWLQDELDRSDVPLRVADLTIEVLTMPRVLGFVFNPVSFWYLRDAQDQLVVTVAEVNNTFSGTHSYVLYREGQTIGPDDWITTTKELYVSPFFQVSGFYRFCFRHDKQHTDVRLNYVDEDQKLLIATRVFGPRTPMQVGQIIRHAPRALFRVWMALVRIHLQALYLYLKGVRLVPRDRGHGRSVKPKKTLP